MELATQKIAELLEQSIGLTVTSIGASSFTRALNNRKRVLGIADDEDYLEKLNTSFMEMRRLVEEVVVPETWFFRDQEPFNYLTEHVYKSPKDLSVDIFRLLSIPCSTGEEPYSIAMTLLQAGLKPTSFYIDAVDVSERSLSVARRGIYRQNSFRTKDIEFRDSFFHKTDEGFSLNAMVREKVRFVRGNMLQPGFLDSLGRYDVVFCRNLLIYFNRESQEKAIKGLLNLLVSDGLLFTGHSEASLFMGSGFESIPFSRAFAFRKINGQQEEAPILMQRREKPHLPGVSFANSKASMMQRSSAAVRKASSLTVQSGEDALEDVRKLADAGELEQAARLCEKNLRQGGPSADWYYLLGVIRDSQGRSEEALKFFRKVVYLDPANVESLVQLALLAERAGKTETAENYRRRARQIQEKG